MSKGKETADFSGENCCILFVLVYLVICLFIMVKVAYWGENWGKNGVSLPRSLCSLAIKHRLSMNVA